MIERNSKEPLSSKQAVVMLLKSMNAKPTSEQAQWLISFMERSDVKGYLDHSYIFMKTMCEYCKDKSLEEIVNDNELYDNIHRYYWQKSEISDEEIAEAMAEFERVKAKARKG